MLWLLLLALLSPIRHGPRSVKQVALTFDACPTQRTDGYDEAIVGVLQSYDVPATMFLSGAWTRAHPAEARRLAQQFEIASHGDQHVALDELGYDQVRRDLARAQATIERVTGKRPRFFRPPAVRYDDEVLRAARGIGLSTVLYDVASGDPDPHLEPDAIVRYVTWKTRPGSVLIFHINGRGWTTAQTLPPIIEALRARGYALVTLSQMLTRPSR